MLFKKMLRDIKKHKIQFITIFLMAFIGVYAFSGIGGEWKGLEDTVNEFYSETEMGDAWVYGNNFSINDENSLKNIKTTTGTERQLILATTGVMKEDPEIKAHFVEKGEIAKVRLIEGEKFNIESDDGIWLDKRFADARKFHVGDEITLKSNDLEITKKIKGLVYSPEYIYETSPNGMIPDFNKQGFGYLSYKAFPEDNIPYNTILLKTNNKNINTYENDVDNALNSSYSIFLAKNDQISVKQFNDEINQHKMMGDIFPVIFLIIAFLTLMTTMTRIVNNQRTQIGILRANGFKSKTILLHYLSYGFWLILIGSILGLILGPLTLPYLFYPSMSSFYTLPHWSPSFDINFIIMAMIVVILSTLISYLSIRSIINETPASAIKPKVPKDFKRGFIEKTKFWKKSSFNFRWNVRNIKRNKIRSVMTIVGIIGCSALLISAFSMNNSMNDLKEWKYGDITHYNTVLSIEEGTSPLQIQKIVEKSDGEAIEEGTVEIRSKGEKKSGMYTITNNTTLITPTNSDRNQITLPANGVSISSKMADMLNIKKGDSIEWHTESNQIWVKSKIVAIYSDPTSQGIIVPLKTYKDLGYNYTPTSILSPNFENNTFEGVKSVTNINTLKDNWDELTEAMMIMVYVMIFFAVLLSIVVLYNLSLLSFTESEREIATLKVIGFKSSDIRKILLSQNIWLTSIGFILGIPLGFLFFY